MVAPSNKEILSWDKKVDLAEVVLPYSTPGLSKTESAQSLFTNKLKIQSKEKTSKLSTVRFRKPIIDGSQIQFVPRQV